VEVKEVKEVRRSCHAPIRRPTADPPPDPPPPPPPPGGEEELGLDEELLLELD
jgi:hypothetical protein